MLAYLSTHGTKPVMSDDFKSNISYYEKERQIMTKGEAIRIVERLVRDAEYDLWTPEQKAALERLLQEVKNNAP